MKLVIGIHPLCPENTRRALSWGSKSLRIQADWGEKKSQEYYRKRLASGTHRGKRLQASCRPRAHVKWSVITLGLDMDIKLD